MIELFVYILEANTFRIYRQTSNLMRTKSQNLNVSRLVLEFVFVQSI